MNQSSTDDLKKRLERTVRDVLNVAPGREVRSLSAKDEPAWDSLRHVELCLKVQSEFGVRFDGSELVRMRNYEELEKTLMAHLKAE